MDVAVGNITVADMNKTMNERNDTKNLTLSAMFLALTFILPFFTGQLKQIGSMLCPMHIPVLLCGFFCGAPWGCLVGAIAPILRSIVLGMPIMFPTAVGMAFELAVYGFSTGFLYTKLPKRKGNVYISLMSAMVLGRLVWGFAMFAMMGFDSNVFGMSAFLSGAVISAIPGILLQMLLVPIIVISFEKSIKISFL